MTLRLSNYTITRLYNYTNTRKHFKFWDDKFEFWNHPLLAAHWDHPRLFQLSYYTITPLDEYTNTRKYFKFWDDRFEFWNNHSPFGAKEITLDYSNYPTIPLHHYTITPLHHHTNTRIHDYTKNNSQNLWFYLRNSPTL